MKCWTGLALALVFAACSSRSDDAAARRFALSPTVIFSEILFNPPGADNNNEFIELQCTPSVALDGYWLVNIEGDWSMSDANARGAIVFAKKLTGVTCGSNGFVVVQLGSVYDGVTGTTYVNKFLTDNIQNGTQTWWIWQGDTFSDPNGDLDDDNDGVIDDASLLAGVVDSVAISDGYVDDKTYSPATLVLDPLNAISRFAGTTDTSAASWYGGSVKGPSPFTYDTTNVTANFPGGGTLSPGAANSASAVLDLIAPPPVDLAGADLVTTSSADLAGADLAGATTADLAGGAPADDLTSATPSDLKKAPSDLSKAADLVEVGTDTPDLKKVSTGTDQDRGCAIAGPGTLDPSLVLALLGALALVRRRRAR